MIKAKHDGQYKQVGFIKVRQPDGTYKDVEKKYGKTTSGEYGLVFEKGFIREVEGALPLQFDGIGKPLKGYDIEGNTYQPDGVSPDTPQEVVGVGERTGNLLELTDDYVADIRGVSVSIKNGALSIKGTAALSGGRNIYLSEAFMLKAGTYMLSGTGVSGLRYCLSKVADGSAIIATYGQVTVTLTEDVVVAFGLNFIEGTTYNATTNIMLNSGSNPLPYEPYGYKVDVESRGKNLWNSNNSSITNSGYLDGIPNFEDGVLTAKGIYNTEISDENSYKHGFVTLSSPIEPILGLSFSFNMDIIENLSNVDESFVPVLANGNTQYNAIKGANGRYTCHLKSKANTYEIRIKGMTVKLYNFQLELGTEATSYEPYHEPITTPIYIDSPLYKIGDYADSIGSKEEVRAVKELVLTGEENWTGSHSDVGLFTLNVRDYLQLNGVISVFNTHYQAQENVPGWTEVNDMSCCLYAHPGHPTSFALYIRDSRFNTIDNFKAFLATQYAAGTPVTVYYILATPETKTVEPVEIPTLDGTTVIDVDTGVKPSNVYIKYKSKT